MFTLTSISIIVSFTFASARRFAFVLIVCAFGAYAHAQPETKI